MPKISDVGSAKGHDPNSIATFTGKFVCPHKLTLDDIDIKDIAHALSNICRFGGHSLKFYLVAQHSVIGAEVLKEMRTSKRIQLSFLLHDAGEAYLYDIARPLKHLKEFEGYLIIQNKIDNLINEKFSVDINNQMIKDLDNIMLSTEKRDVMPDREWSKLPTPLFRHIKPWEPETAESQFLISFNEYTYKL